MDRLNISLALARSISHRLEEEEARAVAGVGGGGHTVSARPSAIMRVLTVPCYLVLAGGVSANGPCNEPERSRCLGGSGSSGDPRLCGKSSRLVLLPVSSRGSSSILPSSRPHTRASATTARLSDQPAERCIPLAGAGGRSLGRDTRAAHRLLATTIHDALTVGSSMVLVSAHPPEEQMLIPVTIRRRRFVHLTNRPRAFRWLELEDVA